MSSIVIFSVQEILTTWDSIDKTNAQEQCGCLYTYDCEIHYSCHCDCGCLRDTPKMWEYLLEFKRKDDCFSGIKESIRENGLVGVLMTYFDSEKYVHLDGHHRLTAMVDLGFTYIPYMVVEEEKFIYCSSTRIGTGLREDIITRVPAGI